MNTELGSVGRGLRAGGSRSQWPRAQPSPRPGPSLVPAPGSGAAAAWLSPSLPSCPPLSLPPVSQGLGKLRLRARVRLGQSGKERRSREREAGKLGAEEPWCENDVPGNQEHRASCEVAILCQQVSDRGPARDVLGGSLGTRGLLGLQSRLSAPEASTAGRIGATRPGRGGGCGVVTEILKGTTTVPPPPGRAPEHLPPLSSVRGKPTWGGRGGHCRFITGPLAGPSRPSPGGRAVRTGERRGERCPAEGADPAPRAPAWSLGPQNVWDGSAAPPPAPLRGRAHSLNLGPRLHGGPREPLSVAVLPGIVWPPPPAGK